MSRWRRESRDPLDKLWREFRCRFIRIVACTYINITFLTHFSPSKARIGNDGVIEVKSPSLFKGYLNLPEKTKQEFTSDGFFITGDMGEMDEKGSGNCWKMKPGTKQIQSLQSFSLFLGYVWIKGRQKDLIISGGLNVYPTEVEDVVTNMFGDRLKECAVIG